MSNMNKKIVSFLFVTAVVCLSAIVAEAQQGVSRRPNSLLNRNLPRNGRTPASPAPAARQTAAANADDGESAAGKGEAPAFNWDATPVDIILQAYGERTGKTILKDPQVPAATITLKSRPGQKLTDEEYLEAIEVILEMNQIHLEPYGDSFIRALPRKDVRKEGIPLYMDVESMEIDMKAGKIPDGKVISLMIQFVNNGVEEAQKALEGFKSNSGILLVFERTNSILATDTKQNIDRMMEIAKKIDIASPVTEVVEYIQIKYASATEIKTVIDSIVQESMKEQEKNGKAPVNQPQNQPYRPLLGGLRRPGQNQQQQQQAPANNASLVLSVSDADRGIIRGKVVTIADDRSNKILLITSATNMKFFKEVIAALDVETNPDTVVKVYRLKYAEAEDVSDMINDLIGNSSSSKNSGRANQNQNAKKGTSGSVTRGNQTAAKKPANQRSGDVKAGELNKDNTTVLADKRINGIVVMTDKELVPTIEQIIESMDIKLSQVLIETVIIEVNLGDGLETGVDWITRGKGTQQTQLTDSATRQPLYWTKRSATEQLWTRDSESGEWRKSGDAVDKGWSLLRNPVAEGYKNMIPGDEVFDSELSKRVTTYTDTAYTEGLKEKISDSIVPTVASLVRDTFVNNTYDGGYSLGGGAKGGVSAAENIALGTSGFDKSGLNLIFKSDKLNLGAIIKAVKTDDRSKYVASPVIMTLDNKEATINATKMRYLLKGFTSSGNSYSTIAVPDYEQKELGIEIKVTPKINPNGTVMLTVEEKYSQVSGSQDIKYATGNSGRSSVVEDVKDAAVGETGSSALETVTVDTTATREMSADVLLENMQTVVFGGLTETFTQETETGIPILKDIPIIGKWLFGSVSQSEARSELLVFMTPYVLDDAQAAQVEALRRKKTMSDPRPWEDHGWSLSPIADPVSKQEQMRRIKDEWRQQDEERKTKIAVEKMKVDRVKKLKEMSKEERDLWLKMHKEELEEEEQDKLEEQMLDPKSQDALKKLAAEIREKKLGEAKKEIDEAEKASLGENERTRLDREAKEKGAGEGEEVKVKGVKPEPLQEINPKADNAEKAGPAKPNGESVLGRLSEEVK